MASQETAEDAIVDSVPTLIDCDLHQSWSDPTDLTDRLPKHFQHRGIHTPENPYSNPNGFLRDEVADDSALGVTSSGSSDIENLKQHHLDKFDIDFGILTGNSALFLSGIPNREYAHALARAYNEWLIESFIPKDNRLVGSLFVALQNPEKSAEMIRELGTHPRIVQVLFPAADQKPFGDPAYWPIYEAATDVGLPIGIHPFRETAGPTRPPTGAGYPSTYFEWHTLLGAYYMGQLTSLITEGVFEEFPSLKMVFIEGGFSWLPHFMWRMDKNWKGLRKQTPWVERPPSEYIREHIWLTTQPMEEPPNPKHLEYVFEMMHAEETLMFSSDWPHWDGDSPDSLFFNWDDSLKKSVLWKNAKEVYGLPDDPNELPQTN